MRKLGVLLLTVCLLASPAHARETRNQAWLELVQGNRLSAQQRQRLSAVVAADPTWQAMLAAGPALESVVPSQRARTFGEWACGDDLGRRRLATALRQRYLLAALPPEAPLDPVQPPFEMPALRLHDQVLSGHYDAIVVGSGPSGSVLANRFTHAGWKVALVERGPLVLPGSCDTRDQSRLKDASGARPSSDGLVLLRNAETVGGGSAVNIDLAFSPLLPFIHARLDDWYRRFGWPGDQGQLARAYAWVGTTLGTRHVPAAEVNANNAILQSGARACGLHPQLYHLNTWAPGSSPMSRTDKRSAVETLLFPAMRDGMTMLPDCSVERVLTDPSGHAIGVDVVTRTPWKSPGVWNDPHQLGLAPDSHFQIRADRVYLCAGSLGTPLLLQRSGLGGPEVGRGPVLHPSFPVFGVFDRTIDAQKGTACSIYVDDLARKGLVFECASGDPAYVGLLLPAVEPELGQLLKNFSRLAGFAVMLVDSPQRGNGVSAGPTIRYRLGDHDRRTLAHGVALACKMMLKAGARRVLLPSTEDLLEDGAPQRGRLVSITRVAQLSQVERNLRFVPGRTLLTSAHLQATCKVGRVVDSQGRVKGTRGLFICDSSVFPESVGANPMQSLYTLAYLFAERQLKPKTW